MPVFVKASRRAKSYFRRGQKIQSAITRNGLRKGNGTKRTKQVLGLEDRLFEALRNNESHLAKKIAKGKRTSLYKKLHHPSGAGVGHGFAPTGFKPFGT